MTRRNALTLLLLACSSSVFAANPFSAKKVEWHDSLQEAHKQAKAENKPMLVVFDATWCTYCKKLEKETLNSPEIVKYINETFVPVHLDVDKEKKVAEILEVKGLPCTVVLSPNADLLGRIKGYQTPGPFYQKLAAARQLHSQSVRQTSQTE